MPRIEREKFQLRQLLDASMVGIYLVVSTVIGLGIGLFLDKIFHSAPWLTIIFLLIGIASGFRELIRVAFKKAREDSDSQDSGEKPDAGDDNDDNS